MQLTYRGIPYNSNTVQAETIDSTQKTARYRGISYSLDRATHTNASFDCHLRYMGVPYCKTLFY